MKHLYGNYRYSLTTEQQSAIQIWLRICVPNSMKGEAWNLLHDLTYAESWSETPQHELKNSKVNQMEAFELLQKPKGE